jgi:hypothetical protein
MAFKMGRDSAADDFDFRQFRQLRLPNMVQLMKKSVTKSTTHRPKRVSVGSIQHVGLASKVMAEALADMATESICSAMRIS